MKTLYYSHPDYLLHNTGPGHPESSDRVMAINQALQQSAFAQLIQRESPLGSEQQVHLIHPHTHIETIRAALPAEGIDYLDGDTVLSSHSLTAALRGVGAVCDAVDQLLNGNADNAFCAIRPPGHHAEPIQAMGFCLFNTVAIAAEYARQHYKLTRIAIVDFDVHHGNGTQAAFYQQPQIMYASTHEMPHYPGTGYPTETGVGNIVNVPLNTGDSGIEFREKYERIILPALHNFKPELLLISAGFDAHQKDPLSSIQLVEDDFRWVTQALMDIADCYCQHRIISVLEGGYNLEALAASVAIHVKTLLGK